MLLSRLVDTISKKWFEANSEPLSKARITKLVYLCDWTAALQRGNQISGIKWYYNHYGPYVEDVFKYIKSEEGKKYEINYDEKNDTVISKITVANDKVLDVIDTGDDFKIIDLVLKKTQTLSYSDFLKFVYSTYPMIKGDRHSYLDLTRLAKLREKDKAI